MGFIKYFRDKLKKQTNIEVEDNQKYQEITDDIDIQLTLGKIGYELFPKDGSWRSGCFKREKSVNDQNLIGHLRDLPWLEELIDKKLRNQGIIIDRDYIREYVTNDELFNKMRHNYELEIVKWQIDYMNNGGEGWLIPNGYDDLSLIFDKNCDKCFRDGVVKTLSAIGLDSDVIEEGLEKNADIWREKYMKRAFDIEYDPIRLFSPKGLEVASEEFRTDWLKLRGYQYYTEHKDAVDKYGKLTPEMQLSNVESKELAGRVATMAMDRQKQIEEWKNSCSSLLA